MRSLENIVMHIFFGCSQQVMLVLLVDHNLEIRIGSKGWVGQAWAGMKWGWEQGLHKEPLPSSMPGMSDPVCLGSPL
jgi:hypothetical protein